ncbi:Triacylglycerol esterase/lipase EstA, alpha/beta hydrolase fold [Cohnella sp. OV330]|uniref:pre-peptidase C-terminal domain-containing protein n=1 Tax=Cohnella sp. OV330 TaxID=1855288 RepID=UPI0008DF754D|nr:pre-peptidase C-terminal domain-containing protein [Cohnella sp. OV330]SFB44885.1 Triacylglycerol esterase/lipase EstA, alpha/beta hydrolase fold [Cohnella sp. OV330]
MISRIRYSITLFLTLALTLQLMSIGIGSASASAPQTEAVQSLAAGDAYEPNDSMSQAKALTSPLWFYADLHTSTDVDWYRFTLDKPTALTASFTFGGFFSGGADYDLELLGADGATLAVSARSSAWLSDEYLSATLPAGSYYWKVRCSNGRLSSYGYSVQATATEIDSYEPNDSAATAKPIGMRPYSWSSGTIHSLTDKDYFKLTLSQPTWIKGTLTYIPSGTNYDLSLVDEAGNVLAKSANAGTADESFKLNLAAGTYYFVVQSASGTSSSPYKLAYSPPWPDSNEWNDTLETAKTLASVPYGALGVGTLHTASDVDYFKFTVDRLSSVSGKLDVPSGENFELALLDGGGTPLIASYKSGSEDELIQTELPQGTYYWRIYAGSVTDSEAYYSLDSKVQRLETAIDHFEPNDSADGATALGPLTKSDFDATLHDQDVDYYKITIPETTRLTATLSAIPGAANYELELVRKDGGNETKLAGSYNAGTTPEKITRTIEPGVYYIKVYSVRWYSSQPYHLELIASTNLDGKAPVILVPGLGESVLEEYDAATRSLTPIWLQTNSAYANQTILPKLYPSQADPNVPIVADNRNNGLYAISDMMPYASSNAPYEFEHAFDTIANSLQESGYKPGSSLFGFPYDWRADIAGHNDKLINLINDAIAISGSDRVVLITHGSGGLVVKNMLIASPQMKSKVKSWIGLGTPHLGTAVGFKAMLNGSGDIGLGLGSVGMHLALDSPGYYSLLPSEGYFQAYGLSGDPNRYLYASFDAEHGLSGKLTNAAATRAYLSSLHHTPAYEGRYGSAPPEDFLETAADQSASLHQSWDQTIDGVQYYEVAGYNVPTPTRYINIPNDFGLMPFAWNNYPLATFMTLLNDEGDPVKPIYKNGDGIVPLLSATGGETTQTKRYFIKDVNHKQLLHAPAVIAQIKKLLFGDESPAASTITETEPCAGLACSAFANNCDTMWSENDPLGWNFPFFEP